MVVIIVFLLGFFVFGWGLYVAFQYVKRRFDGDHVNWEHEYVSLNRLWWQMTLNLLLITLISLVIPFRLRNSLNLYSVIWILLLFEYAIFVFCFPMVNSTATLKKLQEQIEDHVVQRLTSSSLRDSESATL